MRIGARKRPFYRVVAVDERAKRTGGYLELLGTYNPLTEPKEIKLSQEKIDAWKKKGAILSDGFLRIIGQAPARPPRKPKKEKKVEVKAPVIESKTEETSEQTEDNQAPAAEEVGVDQASISESVSEEQPQDESVEPTEAEKEAPEAENSETDKTTEDKA